MQPLLLAKHLGGGAHEYGRSCNSNVVNRTEKACSKCGDVAHLSRPCFGLFLICSARRCGFQACRFIHACIACAALCSSASNIARCARCNSVVSGFWQVDKRGAGICNCDVCGGLLGMGNIRWFVQPHRHVARHRHSQRSHHSWSNRWHLVRAQRNYQHRN